ncbi:MAG: SlyX family protein [Planctomycetota bacterium]
MTEDAQRLEIIETQLAHALRSCEQLNEVVTEINHRLHQRERVIDALVSQVKDLKAKVDLVGDAPPVEKPPHY